MAYVRKKSVLPVYFIGLVWILWALLGPLRSVSHYLLCAGFSLAAYYGGKILFPDRGYEVPDPTDAGAGDKPETKQEEPASTGNPEIDALIAERRRAISEMRRLNAAIRDETISAQIDHLERVTDRIIDTVVAQPAKLPQLRRFMSYYLPTTLKLLNAYDRMDAAGVSGANIDGTKGKIEDMMDSICKAFDKQLDALYGEEALDISTDIKVLENMLAQEGLGGMTMEGR